VADLATVPSSDSVDEVITASVAAREKGVHPVSIYRAIKEGRLKAYRSGNTLLIRRKDLAEWAPIGHRPQAGAQNNPAQPPQGNAADAEEEARRIQREKNQAALRLLRSWREEGDEEEQRAAFEDLTRTLAEDPLSYRSIYP
jgi:excisionase family DNA binding protein